VAINEINLPVFFTLKKKKKKKKTYLLAWIFFYWTIVCVSHRSPFILTVRIDWDSTKKLYLILIRNYMLVCRSFGLYSFKNFGLTPFHRFRILQRYIELGVP